MTILDTPRELAGTGPAPSSDLEIGTIFQIFRRKAWLIALWTALMLGLGVVYLLITPKVYEATTVVQVKQDERPVVSTSGGAPEAFTTPEILKTFEQNLDSGALLLRVYRVNKLDQDPRYFAEKPSLIHAGIKWISHLLPGGDAAPGDAALIREMDDRTVVKLRKMTRLIDVSVRAQDPTLALQLSQSIANEYIRLDLEQKIDAAKPANEYLLKEAERLKDRLQISEQLLQSYKEEQHAVSLEETQNIVVETLKNLNASLSDARAARIKLESDFARLEAAGGRSSDLLSFEGVAASPSVQALKQRIAEMEGVLASLGQRYTPNSPKYLQAESELHKLKLSLDAGIQDAVGIIKASYAAAKDSENKLQAALQEQEQHALDLNRIAIQYNVLSRDVASNQALYDAVLKQLKETQIIQGVGQGGIRIVEPATLPDKPAWPKKIIVLALAMFLGGAIGVGASIGTVLCRAPLTGAANAESQFGIPAFGIIPKARGRRGPANIFLVDNPRSAAAEAIRSLRGMLLLNARDGENKVILFTSAMAGEGRTFCALNVAAALALDGRRTLLIDTDLRSAAIGLRLFGKQPDRGLTDVLSERTELEGTVSPTQLPNLFVLAAGSSTDKPSEMLGSDKMAKLLERLLLSYDHILLDSPPVLKASDALGLVKHAHMVCLVVRSFHTPGRAVARVLQMITSPEIKSSTGLVLNQTSGSTDS